MAQGLYESGSRCGAWRAQVPGNIEKSVGQHIEVAEAVIAGDAAAAAAAYRRTWSTSATPPSQSMASQRSST